MGWEDEQNDFNSWYGSSEQFKIDLTLFDEWWKRVNEQGDKLGEHFDQSYQDRANAAAARINAFKEYQAAQAQRAEQDTQVKMWNADLNQALDIAKPGANALDAAVGKIFGIGLDSTFNNVVMNNPNFQAVADATKSQSLGSEFNWDYKFDFRPPPKVDVIIGGYNKVDPSAVSVTWDSAMGYMHGLAGAQGAYYNRSDDYKASWNLANNAMRTLADAAGKVVETAPPTLPSGRGLTPGMALAGGGAVARPPAVTAPSLPIYFSSTEGNEASASKSKTSVPNANNYRESYLKENPGMPTEFQVHHTLPQKYQETLNGKGINIHETKYLEGIDPDTHRLITKEWQRWEKSLGRTPTAEEIINFAKQIDSKYGEFWYNK